jgi:hypothetical protein
MLNSLREILGNASQDTWWMFVAGYVFMWSSFALVGGGLQIALSHTELLSDHGTLASRSLTAGVLALAGVYQFTPIKNMCRDLCLRPMTFFMAHWHSGKSGGFKIGICWHRLALGFHGTRYRNHGGGKTAEIWRESNSTNWHCAFSLGSTALLHTRSNFSP